MNSLAAGTASSGSSTDSWSKDVRPMAEIAAVAGALCDVEVLVLPLVAAVLALAAASARRRASYWAAVSPGLLTVALALAAASARRRASAKLLRIARRSIVAVVGRPLTPKAPSPSPRIESITHRTRPANRAFGLTPSAPRVASAQTRLTAIRVRTTTPTACQSARQRRPSYGSFGLHGGEVDRRARSSNQPDRDRGQPGCGSAVRIRDPSAGGG